MDGSGLMLATRIIPTMLNRNGQLVKGKQFNSWRAVGNAMQAARIHASRGVDELCYLDIGATPDGKGPDFEAIAKMTEGLFTPITVGGGITKAEEVRQLLASGADKVAICTAAIRDPGLIEWCAGRFGSQAIVAAIDVKAGMVSIECGKKTINQRAFFIAKQLEKYGAGEILLTSIDRDGTMEGYDLDLIRQVANSVDIPVVASGGCKSYDDMYLAIRAGASAVAAGALFQFTDSTPKEAARYLQQRGVTVRV
jgi:cyclase